MTREQQDHRVTMTTGATMTTGRWLVPPLAAFCLAVAIPTAAQGQGERMGAVAGGYDACREAVQPLRERTARAIAKEPSSTWTAYLQHRLAVEMDKCVKYADVPLDATLETIGRYRDLGLNDRALTIAVATERHTGTTPDLDVVIGQLLYARGQTQRALVYLQRVMETRPTDLVTNQLLGAFYYGKGELRRAIPFLRVVAEGRADSFDANAALGDACLAANDLACAGEFLGRASRLRPDDILLAIKLGDLERTNHRSGQAIEAYERALNAAPDRLDALMGLGRVLADAKLWESALAIFFKAAALDPTRVEPTLEMSRALRHVGRPELAAQRLAALAAAAPRPVRFEVEYLLALAAAHQTKTAQEIFRSLAPEIREDDRIAAAMGDGFLAAGSPQVALPQYRRARLARPDAPEYWVREARALRLLGKPADASRLLWDHRASGVETATRELVDAALDYGRELAGQQQIAAALTALTPLAEAGAADADVQLASAALYADAGDFAKAQKWLASAPAGPGKTLVDAWVALRNARPEQAVQLVQALYQKKSADRPAGVVLVHGAALLAANRPEDALAALGDDRPHPGPLLIDWRSQALALRVTSLLRASQYEDAAKLAGATPVAQRSPRLALWLSRVPLIAQAARGALTGTDEVYGEFQQARHSDAKPAGLIDAVMEALADLSHDAPEPALKRLAGRADNASVEAVQTRALIQAGGHAFLAGRTAEAKKIVRAIGETKTLSAEARLNLAVLRNADNPVRLMEAARPFAEQNLAAALFDLAVLGDSAGARPASTIDLLTKCVAAGSHDALHDRAETLLALKTRLYR